jgi:spermidine synthase
MATPTLTQNRTPPDETATLSGVERSEALTLLGTVFLVAACGLIYELLIATISAYLLGSSVTQFSLCIGVFLGAMGFGSWASQWVTRGLLRVFLATEIALGVAGGLSAWILFSAYALGAGYYVVLFGLLIVLGGLVGLELPLLTRLLNAYGGLRTVIAQALSFDYVGALLGSLAFPLLLLPALGTTRTAFLVGFLNLAVAGANVWVFRTRLRAFLVPLTLVGLLTLGLGAGFAASERVSSWFERRLYEDEVIYARQTPFQRIVFTRWKDDLRLFLDGNLQFASVDEYRYHEALVHPALGLSRNVEEVLVLGGGDGLGVREVLKHPGVRRVTLVDIDPAMTRLGRSYPALVRINRGALNDGRVRIVHDDAYKFLERDAVRYGVIIGDLPDPNNEALAKLYSREFYRLVRQRLARGGVFVTQATSPYFARDAFWCINLTLEEAGWKTTPFHVYVPSFGDWGFVLAGEERAPRLADARVSVPTRFLRAESLTALGVFDADIARPDDVDASSLDHPRVLRYYEGGARRWE